jgi:hypothetical protein
MAHTHVCKYCGTKTSSLDVCSNCRNKRPLVKILLDMVRAKKEEIDKAKREKGEE